MLEVSLANGRGIQVNKASSSQEVHPHGSEQGANGGLQESAGVEGTGSATVFTCYQMNLCRMGMLSPQ